MAKKGHVLIDDNDDHVELFRARGGEAILFPQPWNKNREMLKSGFSRVEYVRNALAFVEEEQRVA